MQVAIYILKGGWFGERWCRQEKGYWCLGFVILLSVFAYVETIGALKEN
jgi:hypothetical protein